MIPDPIFPLYGFILLLVILCCLVIYDILTDEKPENKNWLNDSVFKMDNQRYTAELSGYQIALPIHDWPWTTWITDGNKRINEKKINPHIVGGLLLLVVL